MGSFKKQVIVEFSYTCIRIDWRWGRPACNYPNKVIESGPSGAIQTLEELKPFLKRYNMSTLEMAVLQLGAHAVAGSKFHPWGYFGENSGTGFIYTTQNTLWTPLNSTSFQTSLPRGSNSFVCCGESGDPNALGRTPSGMNLC